MRASSLAATRSRAAFFVLTLAALVLAPPALPQQSAPQQGVPSKPQSTVSIDDYIGQSWTVLQRSMTDCHSLIDPKTTTRPILYLPAELPTPPSVAKLKAACGVRVLHLPRRIQHPGDLMPADLPNPGLLYLPNRYVVPGGRFNEMYGWDSYFIVLGLLESSRNAAPAQATRLQALAQGIVENFFFEIEHYGSILNANRTYYLTRSQPPLLSSMIRLVYSAKSAAHPDPWLARAYTYAVQDHALWLTPPHRSGDTGLARYHDLGVGPVPEMEDASSYYPDILRSLLTNAQGHPEYLTEGPDLPPTWTPSSPTPDRATLDALAQASCDPRLSKTCARAHLGTHWLSAPFYEGDRADRESGFDETARFGPFSGSTQNYAPICLNSLLFKYEQDLAWMADTLGKHDEAAHWRAQAQARKQAIDKYLWNPSTGLYTDWIFPENKQSAYPYLTTFYPLWAGLASPEQARAVLQNLHLFLQPGGLATSTTASGLQWDLPNGWAPLTWFALAGLVQAGDTPDAQQVARRFMRSVEEGYRTDGTIREKYDVVSATSNAKVQTGYKTNVVGFGWTNALYLKCQHLLALPPQDAHTAIEP